MDINVTTSSDISNDISDRERSIALSVVIPAYNEAWSLPDVVQSVDKTCLSLQVSYEIVVCNDGSSDQTLPVLRYLQSQFSSLRVLSNERNMGVANTLKRLYRQACGQKVAFWPADAQLPASQLAEMWNYREYDVVIGNRVKRQDSRWRCFASWGFNWLVRVIWGLKVRDIDSVVLYDRQVLEVNFNSTELCLPVEILYKATKRGLSYTEIPVKHLPRLKGQASCVKFKTVTKTLFNLVKSKLLHSWDRNNS